MSDHIFTFSELVGKDLIEIGAGRPRSAGLDRFPLPILRVADVLEGGISPSFQNNAPPADSQEMGSKISRPGDVVLTAKGTVGRVAIMPSEGPTFAYSPQLCYFRPVANGPLRPRYLYYWFKSKEFWDQADALKGQTDMADFLSLSDVLSLKMRIPPLKEQAAVIDVLGSLDDKIATNERLITKADELASATWTLACGDGCAVPLSSLARFVNGKAFTRDASGTGRVVIRIAELNSGIGGSTVYNDLPVPGDHLARPGDLLFAWSGSLTVSRWFREEAIVNQHIFKVIPTGGHPTWLVNQALRDKLQKFKAIAADKTTTMGHIQRHHLDEPVIIPTPGQVSWFDGLISALWERAVAAEQEKLQLENTRDQLLPLLMSGRVWVRETEKVVEGVV